MQRKIDISPVARSVPFDATINGLTSTDVQSVVDEIDNEVNIQQIVWVKQNPGHKDFSTLSAALASITDASSTKRYVIKIAPGIYTENNPVQLKSYIHVVGQGGPRLVQIAAANANQDLLTAADNIFIANLYLNGVSGSGKSLINYPGSSANNTLFNVLNCRFGSTDTAVTVTVGNFNTLMYVHDCTIGSGDQFNKGFLITKTTGTGRGTLRLVSVIATDFAASYPTYIGYTSGASCEMDVDGGEYQLSGATTSGSCFQADTGGDLEITGAHIEGFAKGIYTINSGAAPNINAAAMGMFNNTVDLQIDHTGTTGTFSGSANIGKVNNNSTTFYPNYHDPSSGDLTISGASIPKRRIDQVTSLSTPFTGNSHSLLYQDTTTYLITGSSTGQSIVLPDATNIRIGYKVDIYNQSSQPITLKDGGNNTLIVLSQTSYTQLMLQTNGTAAGSWLYNQVILSIAGGLISYNVISNTDFSSSASVDTLITGMSVTPQSGTYSIWYNAQNTGSGSGQQLDCTIYSGASPITDSKRSNLSTSGGHIFQNSTQTIKSFNGSTACSIYINPNGNSMTVSQRSMLLIRLGA